MSASFLSRSSQPRPWSHGDLTFAGVFLRAYARVEVLRALHVRLRLPRGLERALWSSRSHHLPESRLASYLGWLREEVVRLCSW